MGYFMFVFSGCDVMSLPFYYCIKVKLTALLLISESEKAKNHCVTVCHRTKDTLM